MKKCASTAVNMGAEATSMLTFDASVNVSAKFSAKKYAVHPKSPIRKHPSSSRHTGLLHFGLIAHSAAYARMKRITIICGGVKKLSICLLTTYVLPQTVIVKRAIAWPLSLSLLIFIFFITAHPSRCFRVLRACTRSRRVCGSKSRNRQAHGAISHGRP